jgi:hypothetical protein
LSLPSTAAAVSICLVGSLTACSRARSRSLTLAGGHQSAWAPITGPSAPAAGPSAPSGPAACSAERSASTYSRTSMGSPRVSVISRSTSTRGIPSRSRSAPIASVPSGPGSIVSPSDWLSASPSAVRSTRSRPACSACQLSTSSSGQSASRRTR